MFKEPIIYQLPLKVSKARVFSAPSPRAQRRLTVGPHSSGSGVHSGTANSVRSAVCMGGMSLPPETQVDKRYPIEAGDKWAQGKHLQLVSCLHFLRKEQMGSGLDIYNQPPVCT